MTVPVSIVMPVHNSVRFVEEAINSVLTQTHKMFELIVVDDGSNDGSLEVIENLASKDARIKVLVRGESSGGPAVPRNIGLDAARGEFVAFLDSDDIWYATKLDHQLKFMHEKSAVVSYTAYYRIHENGKILRKVLVPGFMSYKDLLKNTAIATSSAMYDRGIVGDVHFSQQGHEDYAFWLRLVKKHGRCFGLNEDLLKYRVVGGSVSSGKLKSIRWVWKIYRKNEGHTIPYSMWYMVNYGVRAIIKRLY